MENHENKRSRPEVHECNECSFCQESIRDEWNKWFGTLYKATYIDGFIDQFNIKHHGSMEYKRRGKEEVAIKFLKLSLRTSDELFKELNIQRSILINNVNTQFISKIMGITQNAITLEYGIVMKFAEYGDMRKYLSTNFHSTSWSDKLEFAWQIASGLLTIHSAGMVHRDLHSGNILQYYTNRLYIADLGLCQPTCHETSIGYSNLKTTTGKYAKKKNIYGVIPYIPPEVLRGEKFTTAGDIYSFAMILWELATGKPPFHDYSHDQILIMAILNGQRPKITSPIIPPSIAKLIEKCWDPNPENRPTTREVYKRLEKLDKYSFEFQKSEKYMKEHVKGDDLTTKPSERFSKFIKFLKRTIKHREITKISRVIIHPGAVYTSRLLTAQTVDFSTGLVYLPQEKDE
ncbi:hypothetical protein G9A89_023457 [Geosiphon pyriformis]|nr:hypothetical protein G9A89_023457 [Geosiphon pyriformis]